MRTVSRRVVIGLVLILTCHGLIPRPAACTRATEQPEIAGALALPDGKSDQGYDYQLRSEGGLAPLNWRIVSGELPPGLSLEPSGKVKGIPSAPRREAYSFVVEVSDSSQPGQRAQQPCLLRVEAAPLRILATTKQLKVIGPATAAADGLQPQSSSSSNGTSELATSGRSGVVTKTRSVTWPAFDPVPARSENNPASYRFAEVNESGSDGDEFDPLLFVKIYEIPSASSGQVQTIQDAENVGKLIYDHGKAGLKSTRLTADENSSLAIFPNTTGRNIALNVIYMEARLTSADTTQNVEVMNYSEVGVAPPADAFTIGASFETARNILSKLITLQRRSTDILKFVLKVSDREISPEKLQEAIEIDGQSNADELRKRAQIAFEQYTPEIESISSFLLTESNRNIVERVANNLFNIDRDSLVAIAKQFSSDTALMNSKDTDAKNNAIRRLLSRTVQLYRDFRSARSEILRIASRGSASRRNQSADRRKLVEELNDLVAENGSAEAREAVARNIYAYDRSEEAIANLRETKFPRGWISLEQAKAKDGDRLDLTVRVQNPAQQGTGNKVPFSVAIKRYGIKLHWASSFMFLKRLDIAATDLVPDANGNALTDVNFAPSPGVSYGFTYFKRGQTPGSKFLRTLAPTIGINVSFMNFKDPGFDLASGMFTNTKGTDVQVGTGPIISLFNNKLHFIPIGWNLNVDRKRRYWGIGFGFVEFAKELGKYLKSS